MAPDKLIQRIKRLWKPAVAIFMIVAVFITYILYLDNLALENARSNHYIASRSTARVIGQNIGAVVEELDNYALAFAAPYIPDIETITHQLEFFMQTGDFVELSYSDLSGNAVSHEGFQATISRRDFFKSAVAGEIGIAEYVISDFTGKLQNTFAVPVRSGGEVTGVLVGATDANYITDIISYNNYDGHSLSFLVSKSGSVRVAPSGNYLNVQSGGAFFSEDIVILTGSRDELLNDLASLTDSGSAIVSIEGTIYCLAFYDLGFADWVYLSVLPARHDEYSAGIYQFHFVGAILVSVALVAGVVLIACMFRRKSVCVAELANALDEKNNRDPLTGYWSFDYFLEEVSAHFSEAGDDLKAAMLSVDINKFRAVNDLLGHDDGSLVLKKLAEIINRNLGAHEFFARMAADSFVIVMRYNTDGDILARIEHIINDAYYQITEFHLNMAFGIYKIVDRTMDLRAVIDRADLARKTIKNKNDSSFAFFDAKMLSKVRAEKAIEDIMEQALESSEFKVYLQPKYGLNDTEKIIGAEALVRWQRDGQLIPPNDFIPLFEKNGFIMKLDRFVFEEVCKQQKIWLSRGFDMRTISVNMSRVNLQEVHFVHDLYEICNRYNVPTKYFEIEITESVAFESLDILTRVFKELKSYGFHISIDDFGTGYSSLNMLKDLPVDVLKIDRAFLTDSAHNRAAKIIEHVILLAMSLDMRTICEGIETKEQVTLLKGLGCDMAQGFYFARPMPIADYARLIYGEE